MSSVFVRTEIKNYISTLAPTETLIDLSAQYDDIEDMIEDSGLTRMDKWLGIQFVGSDEVPIALGNANSGLYRESGVVYIHVVDVAKLGVADSILARAEVLRNLLRGQRIGGQIMIESVTPPNFSIGATLSFEGGYQSASFLVSYERDLNL